MIRDEDAYPKDINRDRKFISHSECLNISPKYNILDQNVIKYLWINSKEESLLEMRRLTMLFG